MTHSLLEPESIPPPNPWPKRIILVAVLLAVVATALYWQFRYYREEQLVKNFMEALQEGDYHRAYEIWNPASLYTFEKFLQDWGETTSFGRVRSYEIVWIQDISRLRIPVGGEVRRTIRVSGESSGIIVAVKINGSEPAVQIWAEADPPRLSFPPFELQPPSR
jgi:hypothetical protein